MRRKKSLQTNNRPSNIKRDLLSQTRRGQSKPRFEHTCEKYGKRQNNSGAPVSLSVELPTLKQYTHIDLKKTSSYNRIDRSLLKNDKPHHNRSMFIHGGEFEEKKYLFSSKESSNHKLPENFIKEKRWSQQVQKYIQNKQSCLLKFRGGEGFPFMRLDRKNELKRKLQMKERIHAQMPEFIKVLETEDLYLEKSNTTKKPSYQKQQKQKQKQKIDESIKRKGKGMSFFDDALHNANKSQKVLINFIGNYFKHKFSPQKRFAHQRICTLPQEMLSMEIRPLRHL